MRSGRGPRCRGGPGPGGWIVKARVERFTEPAVLLFLREGPKHGYELLERVPELSSEDGHVDLGNLYRLLRALEAEGLVSSEWEAESGPPRRVYRLTDLGAHLLDGWAGSLREIASTVERFLTLYDSGR
jgi:PadR family transcriptional regulator PadR